MNILLLNYEYPPLGGGAGIVSQHLVNGFVIKGHQVTVMTTWFEGEPEYFSENSLTIIRLKSKRKHTYRSNPVEMYSWVIYTKKYLLKHADNFKFDICLANFTLPGGAVADFMYKRWKLPFVILSHGHDIPWFSPKQMFFWHSIFYLYIRYIMRQSSGNVLLTKELKTIADSFVGKYYASKNSVIPNGLLPFKTRIGFNASDKTINALFVGRLVNQKDPVSVIKSIKSLQAIGIPIRLKIIGDGELKSVVENYISKYHLNNIELLGKISHSNVINEYAKAHILIAPSREEAMSLSIMEAISCGVYVFATETNGNRDVIVNGVNGDFVLYNNAQEITQKVIQFYNDKFLKNYKYPNFITSLIQHNYSWDSICDKYITLFDGILNTNKK